MFVKSLLNYLFTLQGEYVQRVAIIVCVACDLPAIEEFRAVPPCLPLATYGNY